MHYIVTTKFDNSHFRTFLLLAALKFRFVALTSSSNVSLAPKESLNKRSLLQTLQTKKPHSNNKKREESFEDEEPSEEEEEDEDEDEDEPEEDAEMEEDEDGEGEDFVIKTTMKRYFWMFILLETFCSPISFPSSCI